MSFGWREIRVAARRLAGRPGFALIAIATLTLGIGATTALWSAVARGWWRARSSPKAPGSLSWGWRSVSS